MPTATIAGTTVHQQSRELSWDNTAPRAARAFVRDVLDRWACLGAEDAYDLAVVVSELVTNVVQHAHDPRHPLELTLDLTTGRCVRVAVTDGSAVDPVVRDLDDSATGGRGLQLVTALVDRWGVERLANGKSVWVEMDLPHSG